MNWSSSKHTRQGFWSVDNCSNWWSKSRMAKANGWHTGRQAGRRLAKQRLRAPSGVDQENVTSWTYSEHRLHYVVEDAIWLQGRTVVTQTKLNAGNVKEKCKFADVPRINKMLTKTFALTKLREKSISCMLGNLTTLFQLDIKLERIIWTFERRRWEPTSVRNAGLWINTHLHADHTV